MDASVERIDAYLRLRGCRGQLRAFLEQFACTHGDLMRGAVASCECCACIKARSVRCLGLRETGLPRGRGEKRSGVGMFRIGGSFGNSFRSYVRRSREREARNVFKVKSLAS
jgi:hypothetical protein